MKNIEKEMEDLSSQLDDVKKEIASRSYQSFLEGNSDEIEKKQFFPVDIYLDTDDPKVLEKVNKSVKEFLKSIDVEMFTKAEIFKGSIIEKFWAGTKSVISHLDLIKKLYAAVRGMLVRKESKPISKNSEVEYSSKRIAETVKALKNVPNITIRIGSMLLTKSTTREIPVIQVKNLSRQEMMFIEQNPNLLRTPKLIHKRLNKLKMENMMMRSDYLSM